MNTIIGAIGFACIIIYLIAEIFRNTLVNVRTKEYANGLKLSIESKEELLQRITSLNSFLVKQVYYNQNGDVEVLGKASKHAFSVDNGVVKPKNVLKLTMGKKFKSAVEEVALLDLLAKQEDPTSSLDPYSKYKKATNIGLVHTISGCIIWGALAVFLISVFMPSSDKYIEMVKQGSNEKYPNVTYEEGFEEFFANPEWSHFTSEKGEVVEFKGNCYFMDKEVEAHFQFLLDLDNSTFSLEYFAINGEPQNLLVTGVLLDKVFSEAEGNVQGNIGDNNVDNVANDMGIPEGLVYDEVEIGNVAGYYQDIEQISYLSCTMYSSPEDEVVGKITIYVDGACIAYEQEIIKVRDNVYKVYNTEEEIYIGFYVYDNFVNAMLYIDGYYQEEYAMQSEYIS